MDFMHDLLVDGRPLRLLEVIDDFNREGVGEAESTFRYRSCA
jgi:putative transposase